jgi:hypothetical protein
MDIKKNISSALLHLKNGDWDAAHDIAQSAEGDPDYDRLHAYLHRVEGDEWNARYWYNRINLPFPSLSIDEELEFLIKEYS